MVFLFNFKLYPSVFYYIIKAIKVGETLNFNFYGNENNKKLLILSPIFSDDDNFKDIIKLFSNYYIIMPDFVNRDSEFISFKQDAKLIEDFLISKGINEIEYGIGFSYGANIFLNLISYNKIIFNNIVLDGLITFKFNKIIRKAISIKLKSYRKDFLNGKVNEEKIYDRFPGMYDIFRDIIKNLNNDSIEKIVNEALNFTMPKISREENIKFIFGERDPNFKNSKRLSRNYPNSKIYKISGCTHVNFIFQNPKKFLEIVEK